MECEYCKNVMKSSATLKQHQKTAKYCLSIQNNASIPKFKCIFCDTSFTLKASMNKHMKICKANSPIVKERENKLLKELELALLKLENSYGYLMVEKPNKATRKLEQMSPEYLLSFDIEFHRMVEQISYSCAHDH